MNQTHVKGGPWLSRRVAQGGALRFVTVKKEIGMNLELEQDGLCLKPKKLLKLRDAGGHTVVCQSGALWLTQHGDRRDVYLGPGESFRLDRNGLTLVQALEQSTISIAPPASRAALKARLVSQVYAALGQVRGALGAQA
jgi:hypothetical protein